MKWTVQAKSPRPAAVATLGGPLSAHAATTNHASSKRIRLVALRRCAWVALTIVGSGCTSFRGRSPVQADSSGTPGKSTAGTAAVRTARFAGDPSQPTTLPPVGPGYAAPPVQAVQQAMPQAAASTVAQQPTLLPQPTAPVYGVPQPSYSPTAPFPAYPPPQPSYAPQAVAATTNGRWPNMSTGSNFVPAQTASAAQPMYGGTPMGNVPPAAVPSNPMASNGLLTPSQPLAQKLSALKLHPIAQSTAVPEHAAQPPEGGRDAPTLEAGLPRPAEPQRQSVPPLASPFDDAAARSTSSNTRPRLDEPFRPQPPASNPIRDAFVPNADQLAPPRSDAKPPSQTGGPEFQVPARPGPIPNRAAPANGTSLEPPKPLFQPPPPAGFAPKQ